MKRLLFILALIILAATSCKKEPDSPPQKILDESKAVTIDTLRAWQQAVSPGGLSITDSLHVYGIITMDETDGNLYKNLYIQDNTGAIQVRMSTSSDFKVGDSLRITLSGAYLSEYAGTIQLDSIDPDLDIVRLSEGNEITPMLTTIDVLDSLIQEEINSGGSNNTFSMQYEGKLIRIDNVQFTGSELGYTYADGINQSSENRILEDCDGNNIIVRTSGFANYANTIIKEGNGSIVAIVGRFSNDIQLLIRSLPELTLDATRCAGELFTKDFEDNSLTSGGWVNFVTVGSTQWIVDGFSGNSFGKCTNWDGSNNELCESWYISPQIDLTASTNASMSFLNDVNYSGPALQLMVSTDYTGAGNPSSTGTWTDISSSVSWDPNTFGWGFHNSGSIDLNAFIGNTIFIAFKYSGTASSGSTWEIDDIKVIG